MSADAYETNRKSTFLLVPPGADLATLPPRLVAQLAPLQFSQTVKLNDFGFRAANPEKIRADLDRQGYSICETDNLSKVSS